MIQPKTIIINIEEEFIEHFGHPLSEEIEEWRKHALLNAFYPPTPPLWVRRVEENEDDNVFITE